MELEANFDTMRKEAKLSDALLTHTRKKKKLRDHIT